MGSMTILSLILVLLLVVTLFIAWQQWQISRSSSPPIDRERLESVLQEQAHERAQLGRAHEQVGELQATLMEIRSELSEQKGKNKQLFAQYTKIESDYEGALREKDSLQQALLQHEESRVRKEKEFETQVTKLDQAQKQLELERGRIVAAEREEREEREAARDRLWNDHENAVIALLSDLCKQPSLSFSAYTNTNLPAGFDGSLKPDFLIDFLGQYVIFDAKVSKAKSLKTYIDDQAKKTVLKVKGNEQIYPWLFFVVPATALSELKQHHTIIDGYHLFVVSPESLPAILLCFKRITTYQFAESMDPQERENIVQLIAELDFHINLRNAADIFLSHLGCELLTKAQKIDSKLSQEVALKKEPMNAKASIAASDIKRLVSRIASQQEEMSRLVAPQASVRKSDLQAAESLLTGSLFSDEH